MTVISATAQQRLGVLTEMDPWSASTRYRALQHVPRLRERFAAVEVSLPHDPQGRAPGRIAQLEYFALHARRYARRALMLPAFARRADALFVQRGLYVIGPGGIVEALRGFDGRIVYDLDDAVFRPDPALARKSVAAQWLYGGQQARRLLQRADAVVVSTVRLAEQLPRVSVGVTVLPTVPDVVGYPLVAHTDARPTVVGWAGTGSGLGYLDPLAGVFGRLAAEGLAELEVVAGAPWSGPARFHRWTLAEESSLFARFQIGIMPLPESSFTAAKAGFKLLQYMAAGLPVVASPIGINVELVESSGAGLLAESPAEWEQALRQLASDAPLRCELGRRGREFVTRYGDLEGQADTLAGLLAR